MSPLAQEYEAEERAEWQNETEAHPRSGCHCATAIPQEYADDNPDHS